MVSGAALLGALEIVGKQIDQVRVVFVGAGAAGIACAGHYLRLGVQRERMLMVDTKGVIYTDRARRHESLQGAVCPARPNCGL